MTSKWLEEIKKKGIDVDKLNNDIKQFPQVKPLEEGDDTFRNGVGRMVMLDRYAFKDTEQVTIGEGDIVILTVKDDPQYPARGIGKIKGIDTYNRTATILVEEEYRANIEDPARQKSGIVKRKLDELDKPLELAYEQIADRVARGLASAETSNKTQKKAYKDFKEILTNQSLVPAGRVLYGAGSEADVTFFNCFVLPYPKDSREGLSEHRATAMEIMSRGGGVGTNGSTLRPSNALARGVNGKSSGSVSWLHDLSELTHLIQQGGSRRGAQMIMLQVDHPDIIEFIISKMQNPRILRYIIENTEDEEIKQLAQDKLKFTPLTQDETTQYETISAYETMPGKGGFNDRIFSKAKEKLRDGGTYSVNEPDFLTGANISVAITNDFMKALEQDEDWELRFPDTDNYTEEEMQAYDKEWHEVGDVREWEELGYGVKTYRTIKAKELWNLVNICATYAAEPGIFFIDRANEDTNAKAYGQKVVATNPCGEQPLAGFSVCNLSAINLAEVADKENNEVDYDKLKDIVGKAVRLQDNIIDATPYFLDENEEQAFGERRIGLGVMGLADLLIYNKKRYGSKEGNELVDKVFETIAVTAYETSIELAKEKGSFPFLIGETEEETQELRNKFINTGFMKRMPEHVRQSILEHGIRNSHLLTVAPTGSTGTMVGVSTGLEPYFAFKYFRSGRLGKFIEVNSPIVQEYLDAYPEADADNLPDFFVSAMELSPEDHVDVQTTIQRWVDSSISKTVNAPAGYSVEEVQKVYERLYKGGAKGGTVYVDGSRDSQVLTLKAEENEVGTVEYKQSKDKEVRVVDDVNELKHLVSSAKKEHALQKGDTDDVVYGSEVGETCPICRQGTVADIGGCNTCTNCQAQLRCGL